MTPALVDLSAHRKLLAEWTGTLLPGQRYVSVFRPELVLEEDDVEACSRCGGDGTLGESRYPWGPIDCEAAEGGCDGFGLIHGYKGNEGMPVAIVEGASL
jgi:hypothetical protein